MRDVALWAALLLLWPIGTPVMCPADVARGNFQLNLLYKNRAFNKQWGVDIIKYLHKTIAGLLLLAVLVTFGGCKPQASAAQLLASLQAAVVPAGDMQLPKRTIIALGEATQGNKELAELRKDVFVWLVENQGCRVFVLEGDFGGCQKVNEYIQTGNGSAEQAAREIGFAIYNTQEMADLIEWMRQYNLTAPQNGQLHFYGYDMQRYDNNKEGLFAYLAAVAPQLAQEYKQKLAGLRDETVFEFGTKEAKDGYAAAKELLATMQAHKDEYSAASSEREYDLAVAFCTAIAENANLRSTNVVFAAARSEYMAPKVQWVLEHEEKYYGNHNVFITGHNAFVEKTSAEGNIYTSMGAYLCQIYGEEYYAIGTEFYESTFLARNAKTDERDEFYIQNKGDTRLAVLCSELDAPACFLDMETIWDELLYDYVRQARPISSIGDEFEASYAVLEVSYTLKIVPAKAYDAMILCQSLTPSTML